MSQKNVYLLLKKNTNKTNRALLSKKWAARGTDNGVYARNFEASYARSIENGMKEEDALWWLDIPIKNARGEPGNPKTKKLGQLLSGDPSFYAVALAIDVFSIHLGGQNEASNVS